MCFTYSKELLLIEVPDYFFTPKITIFLAVEGSKHHIQLRVTLSELLRDSEQACDSRGVVIRGDAAWDAIKVCAEKDNRFID
jgi:hypothetical protein